MKQRRRGVLAGKKSGRRGAEWRQNTQKPQEDEEIRRQNGLNVCGSAKNGQKILLKTTNAARIPKKAQKPPKRAETGLAEGKSAPRQQKPPKIPAALSADAAKKASKSAKSLKGGHRPQKGAKRRVHGTKKAQTRPPFAAKTPFLGKRIAKRQKHGAKKDADVPPFAAKTPFLGKRIAKRQKHSAKEAQTRHRLSQGAFFMAKNRQKATQCCF